jgi:hypothetical protein
MLLQGRGLGWTWCVFWCLWQLKFNLAKKSYKNLIYLDVVIKSFLKLSFPLSKMELWSSLGLGPRSTPFLAGIRLLKFHPWEFL